MLRWGVRVCCGAMLFAAGLQAADKPVREAPAILNGLEHGVGQTLADISFSDLSGRSHRLSDWHDRAALVIAFTDTGCPIAKKYAPELARLEKRFAARGVGFIYVNPNASDETQAMQKDVADHRFVGPYVHDAEGAMGSRLQATSTTEVFVFDSARKLMYRGAVDDRYGFGYALDAPRHAFLVDAIESVLAKRPLEVAATSAPGCVLKFDRVVEAQASLTYHARVSRIVQQHCLRCHHEGGLGPFALDDPEALVDRRAMIRRVVERGIMPPWFAAPGTGPWHNDASLPEADRRDLLAWLATKDHPLGDPAHAPEPKMFPKDWRIGTPDLVVELPRAVSVKAEGQMPYVNLNVATTFEEDRWIQAVEVQPTSRGRASRACVCRGTRQAR